MKPFEEIQAIVRPAWENADPNDRSDWRNHIGLRTRDIWPSLTQAAKLAIAEDMAEVAFSLMQPS